MVQGQSHHPRPLIPNISLSGLKFHEFSLKSLHKELHTKCLLNIE